MERFYEILMFVLLYLIFTPFFLKCKRRDYGEAVLMTLALPGLIMLGVIGGIFLGIAWIFTRIGSIASQIGNLCFKFNESVMGKDTWEDPYDNA